MQQYVSHSYQNTIDIASNIAKQLVAGDVIAFTGGLGAGKTAFTTGLCLGLSIDCDVSSPTFSLVHEYKNNNNSGLSLFHFDMYRIGSLEDLYSTGFYDYLDLNQILAIEWSENITDFLETNTIYVNINVDNDTTRTITITGGERF